MNQHLIAIDLDGTTLNNQSQLSSLTIRTLRKLSELGHMVCIVTGRPYRTSIDIYHQLGIQSPMVNFNGAYCHFPNRPDWIPSYHKELDREIALELFADHQELDVDLICAEGINQLYTSSMKLPESPYYPMDDAKYVKLSRQTLIHNPIALTLFTSEECQAPIQARILAKYGDDVSVRTWGGEYPVLEVVHAGIHKAIGVKTIADFYHIPRANIYSFGDEDNDLEMIGYAGHGVAMKNAIDSVKAIADHETRYTNDEDGLARFLIEAFSLEIWPFCFALVPLIGYTEREVWKESSWKEWWNGDVHSRPISSSLSPWLWGLLNDPYAFITTDFL